MAETVPSGGKELRSWLRGRKVSVAGLGRSGLSAAQALSKCGCRLFLSERSPRNKSGVNLPTELKNLEQEWGGHTKRILQSDLIVVSPGVDLQSRVFAQAGKDNLPVWGEIELGYRLGQLGKIAAITGTNGKTTTVSLLGDMCRRSGRKTLVAGNIGKPLCDYVNCRAGYDLTVLEVSSYQLESIVSFRADAAAVLNVTEDHLSRHKTMVGYASAKRRIFLNQSDRSLSVLNADDPWCRKMARGLSSEIVWFSVRGRVKSGICFDRARSEIMVRKESGTITFPAPSHLLGTHNIENSCAAVGLALGLGVRPETARESLAEFRGVAHRLEKAAVIRGVTYINDSKSTNVDSTLKALQSFSKPIWLILGGQDKGAPYTPLRKQVQEKVKVILTIGESATSIAADLKGAAPVLYCKTLGQAVRESYRQSRSGEIVLLSPACASFDQFKNFEDRGNQFKEMVKSFRGKRI